MLNVTKEKEFDVARLPGYIQHCEHLFELLRKVLLEKADQSQIQMISIQVEPRFKLQTLLDSMYENKSLDNLYLFKSLHRVRTGKDHRYAVKLLATWEIKFSGRFFEFLDRCVSRKLKP